MPQIKYIQYSTAATGSTITCTDTTDDIQIIHEDTVLTVALTLAMPATPVDGQRIYFMSVKGVTTLTMSTSTGTIVSALTTLAANTAMCFIYRASSSKFYRVL